MSSSVYIGNVEIGAQPCVVGTLSSPAWMTETWTATPPCDVIELRFDVLSSCGISMGNLARFSTHAGRPGLFTFRIAAEGGQFTGPDAERLPAFMEALEWASAVDVELASHMARDVAAAAWLMGKPVITSHHDFTSTPPLDVLEKISGTMEALGPGVIGKIVTRTDHERDLQILKQLIRHPRSFPLCLMGMGELAMRSRLELPALGSALVYGYLDAPAAPGQMACAELWKSFGRAGGQSQTRFARDSD